MGRGGWGSITTAGKRSASGEGAQDAVDTVTRRGEQQEVQKLGDDPLRHEAHINKPEKQTDRG